MSGFDELVGCAVVGTARQDPAALRPPPELAGLELPDTAPERRLLDLAAALDLAQRAGRRLAAAATTAAPAPPDRLPPCGSAAASLLTQLLAEDSRPLLRCWLMHATRAGCRVPAPLLPELLGRVVKDAALSREAAPLLDARGAWLCARNPAWQPLLGHTPAAPDAAAWQEGTAESREAALRAAVAADRALARDWVQQLWASDPAKLRERWLACFSPAQAEDEAFLDARLEDRGEGVRSAAARLLLQLPASQLRARALQRALGCLKTKRKLLGGHTLEVLPPQAFDPAWTRDGIQPKAPQGTGERAHWLAQILSQAAPSELAARLGIGVETLFTISGGDWAELLAAAWIEGAVRCRDQAALRLLLPGLLAAAAPQAETLRLCLEAVGTAAADAALAAALPQLQADHSGYAMLDLALAERAAQPYPAALAAALAAFIERALDQPDSNAYWLRRIPAAALTWLADADAADLRRRWLAALPRPDPLHEPAPRDTARRELLDFLERRIAIAAAFLPAAPGEPA